MKSICIKTNNDEIINYLFKLCENIPLNNIFITIKKFKHYNNFIIHCKNKNISEFNSYISNTLTHIVLNYYEKEIIKTIIKTNYFYFSNDEQKDILQITNSLLLNSKYKNNNYLFINNKINKEIETTHSFYLDAFITFSLKNYINTLNTAIEKSVNKFLIEKEYWDFVNMLRLYIESESNFSTIMHLDLVYKNKTSILFDEKKSILNFENSTKNKYISDISFSENDKTLNTLLTLLPNKITVHIIDNSYDEFIDTLILIFQDRIEICENCNLCNIYNLTSI